MKLKDVLRTFLVFWVIGAMCSLIPFWTVGLILGLPAYTLAAVLATLYVSKR